MTRRGLLILAGLACVAAAPASAQDGALERRVARVEDGTVRFDFDARPGVEVCDQGIRWGGGRIGWRHKDGWSDFVCEEGRVEVELELRDGRVRDVDVVRPGEPTDRTTVALGRVEPWAAVDYLLSLAYRGATNDAAEAAVLPAVLADVGEVWPVLLELARDAAVGEDVRRSALFWVGQEAAEAVVSGLSEVALDGEEAQEVRNAAVFALSQRDDDESVPALIEIAQTGQEAETRKTAMFWLAQSGDPRVVSFFEEILLGGKR